MQVLNSSIVKTQCDVWKVPNYSNPWVRDAQSYT